LGHSIYIPFDDPFQHVSALKTCGHLWPISTFWAHPLVQSLLSAAAWRQAFSEARSSAFAFAAFKAESRASLISAEFSKYSSHLCRFFFQEMYPYVMCKYL
jgi:hypothetical protein